MIWWLAAVLVIPAFFWQTLFHEGAHALVAKLYGGDVLSFRFWPHKSNGKFYFGRVQFLISHLDTTPKAMVFFAPMMFGVPMFVVYGALAWICACLGNEVLATIFLVLHVFCGVDVGRGFLNRYIGKPWHDINQVFTLVETPKAVADIVPALVAAHILCLMAAIFLGVLTVA